MSVGAISPMIARDEALGSAEKNGTTLFGPIQLPGPTPDSPPGADVYTTNLTDFTIYTESGFCAMDPTFIDSFPDAAKSCPGDEPWNPDKPSYGVAFFCSAFLFCVAVFSLTACISRKKNRNRLERQERVRQQQQSAANRPGGANGEGQRGHGAQDPQDVDVELGERVTTDPPPYSKISPLGPPSTTTIAPMPAAHLGTSR